MWFSTKRENDRNSVPAPMENVFRDRGLSIYRTARYDLSGFWRCRLAQLLQCAIG